MTSFGTPDGMKSLVMVAPVIPEVQADARSPVLMSRQDGVARDVFATLNRLVQEQAVLPFRDPATNEIREGSLRGISTSEGGISVAVLPTSPNPEEINAATSQPRAIKVPAESVYVPDDYTI